MSQSGSLAPGSGTATAAANVLIGFQNAIASGGPTTVITVPAGRIWKGEVSLQVTCFNAAANTASAVATGLVTTAGTGVVPAAGSYLRCDAVIGADTGTGLDGTGATGYNSIAMVVIAPAGNGVTLQLTSTVSGSGGRINCTASGQLQ